MRKFFLILITMLKWPSRIFTNISLLALIIDSKVDKKAAISYFTKFYRSSIQKYSYVGDSCFIINTSIGKFCSIAGNCTMGVANHPLDWVSTSPIFHSGKNILRKNFSELKYKAYDLTVIGNDVWIGEGVLIKSGIKIGDGAVIGAKSLVTKNVEPYSVVGGIPAKEIRKRFSSDIIEELLNFKWWDLSDDELETIATTFNDIDEFRITIKKQEI